MPLDDQRTHAAAEAAWLALADSHDRAAFSTAWLGILCEQIGDTRTGLLLLGPEDDGAFVPAAVWQRTPGDVRHLAPFAERVLAERGGLSVVLPGDGAGSVVALPIIADKALRGAVVLEIQDTTSNGRQRASRLAYWATAWVLHRVLSEAGTDLRAGLGRVDFALGATAAALEGSRAAALVRVVNDIASRIAADKVSIGFLKAGQTEIAAISNLAHFDPRMGPIRQLGAAMDEAVDLGTTVVLPAPSGSDIGHPAHETLAQTFHDGAICSVLLKQDGETIGVLTCEYAQVPDAFQSTVENLEAVAALLGPVFALHEAAERGAMAALRHAATQALGTVFGPRHPARKFLGVLLLLALAIGASLHGTYRVTAKAVTEGLIQQAAIAPFDGHIAEAYARAGDVVAKGQSLARLDDRDLQLELQKEIADRAHAQSRKREALANNDRAAMEEAQAQIAAADARIALSSDRLKRAKVVAPFDGVVVSGDLSQMRGAPVQQGKLLFQIAPLNSYRVVLDVDERDIAALRDAMPGTLRLEGLPSQQFAFTVTDIMPVTSQADGHNFFRVEARLLQTPTGIRPGMEGVGKIAVGQRRWLWILTHRLTDWLSLWAWNHLP